jgi:hypothetical protein
MDLEHRELRFQYRVVIINVLTQIAVLTENVLPKQEE